MAIESAVKGRKFESSNSGGDGDATVSLVSEWRECGSVPGDFPPAALMAEVCCWGAGYALAMRGGPAHSAFVERVLNRESERDRVVFNSWFYELDHGDYAGRPGWSVLGNPHLVTGGEKDGRVFYRCVIGDATMPGLQGGAIAFDPRLRGEDETATEFLNVAADEATTPMSMEDGKMYRIGPHDLVHVPMTTRAGTLMVLQASVLPAPPQGPGGVRRCSNIYRKAGR